MGRSHEVHRRTSSPCPTWRARWPRMRTARCGRSPSARIPSGLTAARAPRETSSSRGSDSSIRPARRPTPRSSTTSRTPRRSTRSRSPIRGGRRPGQGRLDAGGHPRGSARLLPGAGRVSGRAAGPQASIEKYGDKWTEAANLVCNGPFILESWEHNKVMVLRKNKHFFGAKDMTLDKVVIPIIPAGLGPPALREQRARPDRAADRRPQAAARRPRTGKEVFRYPFPGPGTSYPR